MVEFLWQLVFCHLSLGWSCRMRILLEVCEIESYYEDDPFYYFRQVLMMPAVTVKVPLFSIFGCNRPSVTLINLILE